MAEKLTRLTHKIAIQLHLVAESCTICSYCSRRPVRKLLDTPSYITNVASNLRIAEDDELQWMRKEWLWPVLRFCSGIWLQYWGKPRKICQNSPSVSGSGLEHEYSWIRSWVLSIHPWRSVFGDEVKAYRGSGGATPHILGLGTRWKCVVSFTHRPLYPQVKNLWYPLCRRLCEPQSRSGSGGEGKHSQPLPGLEPPINLGTRMNWK
jgi:hypothetical protein